MDSPIDRRSRLFMWLLGLFVAALLTGDLIGGKYFRLGSVDLSVGMLAFPLTFVMTDVLNEFFGPARTRLVTFVGLGAAIFTFTLINIAIALPTSPESPLPGATFATAFGSSRRLIIASLSAYLIGQLLDISLFTLLRRVTRHRMLWLRATGSTLGSQLIDTLVVNFIFLGGLKSVGFILGVVRDSYVIKILFALALTPLIYAIHALVLRVVKVGEPPEAVFSDHPPKIE
jgi:queuosine precursor transporter